MSNTFFADAKAVIRKLNELGDNKSLGAMAPGEYAIMISVATAEGHIADDKGKPNDVAVFYEAYKNGKKVNTDAVVEALPTKTHEKMVSNSRVIVRAASQTNVDFAGTLNYARPLIAKRSDHDIAKGTVWDHFVNLARAQVKIVKEQRDLTQDEIMTVLKGDTDAKEPKTELERITALAKQARKEMVGVTTEDGEVTRTPIQDERLSRAVELLDELVGVLTIAKMDADFAAEKAKMLSKLVKAA